MWPVCIHDVLLGSNAPPGNDNPTQQRYPRTLTNQKGWPNEWNFHPLFWEIGLNQVRIKPMT